MLGVDHMRFVDVKVKGVVGVLRVMRVAAQGFFPTDDLADILDDGFALGKVGDGEHALAMHARASGLDAPSGDGCRGWCGSFGRNFV